MENKNLNKESSLYSDRDDTKIAHQTVCTMYTHEAQLVWHRYNVLLVANSILLAIIGIISSKNSLSLIFSISLPVVGFVLCIIWHSMTKKGFAATVHWAWEAERIESSLPEIMRAFSNRRNRINGASVTYTVGNKTRLVRNSWLSRHIFSIHRLSYAIIWLFGIIYLLFIFEGIKEFP